MITRIRYAESWSTTWTRAAIWKDLFDLEPVNDINTNQYEVRAQMLGVGESRSSR